MAYFIRLLHVDTLEFKDFRHNAVKPRYACASHRWLEHETSYLAFRDHRDQDTPGRRKVLAFTSFLRQNYGPESGDHIEWIWIDSCCINRSDGVELGEAINTMCHIYRMCAVCLAYLQDIGTARHTMFVSSEWFSRGWTLQELLAPSIVLFLDEAWRIIGHKASYRQARGGHLLNEALAAALPISKTALTDFSTASISDNEKWTWIRNRQTEKPEDLAYCLLGVFGVSIPIIYGEGEREAVRRLKEALRPAPLARKDSLRTRLPGMLNNSLVMRTELFDRIKSRTRPGTRVVLVGRAGIGKTQLAHQFARHILELRTDTRIIPLFAGNPALFDQSIEEAAGEAPRGASDRYVRSTAFEQFHDVLSEEARPWLVILDGADDVAFLQRHPPGNIRRRIDYIPTTSNGRVLITTHSQLAAQTLAYHSDIISVPPMSPDEALQLLVTIIGPVARTPYGPQIVKQLDYMPLAINAAGIYLYSTGKTTSNMERYSEVVIRKGADSRLVELKKRNPLPDRNEGDESSLLFAYQASFDYISSMRPSATDLLCLMSLCDHAKIPIGLLRDVDVDNAIVIDAQWEQDVATLLSWDFIAAIENSLELQMHSTIQDAARDWLSTRSNKTDIEEQLLTRLHKRVLEAEQAENQSLYSSLLPHAAATVSIVPTSGDLKLMQADLLERAASYTIGSGNLINALAIAQVCLRIREELLEPLNDATIRCVSLTAEAHRTAGNWKSAIGLQTDLIRQVNEARLPHGEELKRRLSRELASTYAANQQWTLAEAVLLNVLGDCMLLKGEAKNTREEIKTKAQLANVYLGQGRFKTAEAKHRDILSDKETYYPDEELSILSSKGDLAVACKKLGLFEAALTLENAVLTGRQQLLGASHRFTIAAMTNLATTYRQLKQYERSRGLGEEALALAKGYGTRNPTTLTCMNDLSITYARLGDWGRAEELQQELVNLTEKVFGIDELRTFTAKALLAATYRNTNREDMALRIEEAVFDARKAQLGTDHPDTMRAQYNMSLTHWKLGHKSDARGLMEKVIQLRTLKYGDDHMDTKEAIATLRTMRLRFRDMFERYIGPGYGRSFGGIMLTVVAVITGYRTWPLV